MVDVFAEGDDVALQAEGKDGVEALVELAGDAPREVPVGAGVVARDVDGLGFGDGVGDAVDHDVLFLLLFGLEELGAAALGAGPAAEEVEVHGEVF